MVRRPADARRLSRSGRPLGSITRGTTHPNRLRRADRWLLATYGDRLRAAADPLVVDLGYGRAATTTVELARRLWDAVGPHVRVLGLEIDPQRVLDAAPAAVPGRLAFARGGFELAGERPLVVRAFNVLRQYAEEEVAPAWAEVTARLAPDGVLVDGTCDELGRVATWVTVDADGPRTLTLAADTARLERPAVLAERLPKALIHHNVPGTPVHALLAALDAAWAAEAAVGTFGGRQRWAAAAARLAEQGLDLGPARRWRYGEVTVPWEGLGLPG